MTATSWQLGKIKIKAGQEALSKCRARVTVEMSCFRGADDRQCHRGGQERRSKVLVCAMQLEKVGQLQSMKYVSDKAHRLALEWTCRMQWMYDAYVVQDDETFEYSTCAPRVLPPARQIGRLSSALFGPSTSRKHAIVVRVAKIKSPPKQHEQHNRKCAHKRSP